MTRREFPIGIQDFTRFREADTLRGLFPPRATLKQRPLLQPLAVHSDGPMLAMMVYPSPVAVAGPWAFALFPMGCV